MNRPEIRQAEPNDVAALLGIYRQPEVYENLLQLPHPSTSYWLERITHPQPGQRHLVALAENQVVGHMGLTVNTNPRRSHVATLGLCVDPAFRQQGIGRALMQEAVWLCDNWLRVTRIELTVFADNQPAIRAYQRVGFELEGRAKDFGLRNGIYVDALFMARHKPA
ncbi:MULTISPECIES: GNAT family N-acetyltransferase [Mangrovibacter]|uniref:Putative acetyltransferase n=1 Tax=Mangrovibacter plantisponsor TaxID=451513 RepID=A0A317PP07_9ENTR|nr:MULTISPECIES: GNAT family N-acetyltransferase [Mangrovibacter]KEA51723.1 acetyltransferase [Mangrovibacter sp. MFB070]PWW02945.1 putative acetyltransferase [Mangrovibacter plantisponsor]